MKKIQFLCLVTASFYLNVALSSDLATSQILEEGKNSQVDKIVCNGISSETYTSGTYTYETNLEIDLLNNTFKSVLIETVLRKEAETASIDTMNFVGTLNDCHSKYLDFADYIHAPYVNCLSSVSFSMQSTDVEKMSVPHFGPVVDLSAELSLTPIFKLEKDGSIRRYYSFGFLAKDIEDIEFRGQYHGGGEISSCEHITNF